MGARKPVLTAATSRLVLAASLAAAVFAVDACRIEQKPQPTHRGVYMGMAGGVGSVPGNELNTFVPCGSDSMYWVEGRAKAGLQARYADLARRQFQPVYVELKAQILPRGTQMPMEGHNGNIRIDTVLTVTTQVPVECRPKVRPE